MSRLEKAKAERERLLAEIEKQRSIVSAAQTKIAEMEAGVRDADAFIRGWDLFGEDSAEAETVTPEQESPGEASELNTTGGQFHGMGLPAASTLVLKMSGRKMTAKEVTTELERGGVKLAAKDPVRSVEWALRRSSELGHVAKVGKLWVLLAAPSEAVDIEKDTRSSRTRVGLAVARERGVRLGAPAKLTEKHREAAISLLGEGRSVTEIAKLFGVSRGGLVRKIREWRDEGRFPAARYAGDETESNELGMIH